MFYTDEMKKFLAEYVPNHSRKEITDAFNRRFNTNLSVNAVASSYKRYGLSTGRNGYFIKGTVSHNKGKKRVEYMSAEGIEKSKATRFKSGHRPATYKPVGSERIDAKNGYLLIKVADPNVWKLKHRVVWESVNGKIPEGKIVIFLDQNKLNCNIENLCLTDRATQVRANQHNLLSNNADITRTGLTLAKLMNTLSNAKKIEGE